MKEIKQKKKTIASTVGTVFIDIGKLAIGSLIFGAILRGSINPIQIVLFGTAFAILFVIIGISLVVFSKE